jgi:hypothetical protein
MTDYYASTALLDQLAADIHTRANASHPGIRMLAHAGATQITGQFPDLDTHSAGTAVMHAALVLQLMLEERPDLADPQFMITTLAAIGEEIYTTGH